MNMNRMEIYEIFFNLELKKVILLLNFIILIWSYEKILNLKKLFFKVFINFYCTHSFLIRIQFTSFDFI